MDRAGRPQLLIFRPAGSRARLSAAGPTGRELVCPRAEHQIARFDSSHRVVRPGVRLHRPDDEPGAWRPRRARGLGTVRREAER
jgi:hypothetical protein